MRLTDEDEDGAKELEVEEDGEPQGVFLRVLCSVAPSSGRDLLDDEAAGRE